MRTIFSGSNEDLIARSIHYIYPAREDSVHGLGFSPPFLLGLGPLALDPRLDLDRARDIDDSRRTDESDPRRGSGRDREIVFPDEVDRGLGELEGLSLGDRELGEPE